jgi:hypothetical protein
VPPFAQVDRIEVGPGKTTLGLKGAVPAGLRDFLDFEVYYPSPSRNTQFGKVVVATFGTAKYPSKPALVRAAALVDSESLVMLRRIALSRHGNVLAYEDKEIRSRFGSPALVVVRYVPASLPLKRIDLSEADVQVIAIAPFLRKVQFGVPGWPGH